MRSQSGSPLSPGYLTARHTAGWRTLSDGQGRAGGGEKMVRQKLEEPPVRTWRHMTPQHESAWLGRFFQPGPGCWLRPCLAGGPRPLSPGLGLAGWLAGAVVYRPAHTHIHQTPPPLAPELGDGELHNKTRPCPAFGKRPPAPIKPKRKPDRLFVGARGGAPQ